MLNKFEETVYSIDQNSDEFKNLFNQTKIVYCVEGSSFLTLIAKDLNLPELITQRKTFFKNIGKIKVFESTDIEYLINIANYNLGIEISFFQSLKHDETVAIVYPCSQLFDHRLYKEFIDNFFIKKEKVVIDYFSENYFKIWCVKYFI